MKRIVLMLLTIGLIVANDAVSWGSTVANACPGKCPFCP